MSFTVRRAESTDRDVITAFIRATYGADAPYKYGRRYEWQFIENPARSGNGIPYWLAIDDETGDIAGAIAVQEGTLWLNGALHEAGWIVDVMVDARFRGKGLGHRIHSAVAEEVPILVTLTMAAATRRIAERHGCVTLGPTQQFNRPLRVTGAGVRRYVLFKTRNKPAPRRIASILLSIPPIRWISAAAANLWGGAAMRRDDRGSTSAQVEQLTKLEERDEAFLSRVQESRPKAFARTPGFFRWRFMECPDLEYELFRATRDGETVGLLVLRNCIEGELPSGVIVEALTTEGDDDAADAMIRFAANAFWGRAQALDAAASTPDMVDAFRRAGFVPTRTMRPTVVLSDAELARAIDEDRSPWYFLQSRPRLGSDPHGLIAERELHDAAR